MNFIKSDIPEVVLVEPKVFPDGRGFFMETWNERVFAENGVAAKFVQDNQSKSVRHTLRGLHYQVRQTQGKLVRALSGEVFDVAVDLRKNSRHFGRWVGAVLSGENKKMVWVPPGFAHGFLVLSETAEVAYKCTDFYAPANERSLLWNDPRLAIKWPLPSGAEPILSPKDAAGAEFSKAEYF
ncbi:MAG: dTDP-4-dehydrorhamnose 3,5-epimerase [Nitrospinae bacterium]|nr:dTDP-4-dehydrorhamnose 3,5-epimerase [Nitrospinota bacterium]